jgi:hypothetical protein
VSRALVTNVRAVEDPIVRLAIAVTEAPWSVTRDPSLDPAIAEHVVLQASLFGHLNRIADAVDVPNDYPDDFGAPHVDPSTPMYAIAPAVIECDARVTLPNVADALAAWRSHAFERDAALLRAERAVIRDVASRLLGERTAAPRSTVEPADTPRERALAELTEVVARAPWRLNPQTYAPLYALGFDHAGVFDAIATASTAVAMSRIAVALTRLTS